MSDTTPAPDAPEGARDPLAALEGVRQAAENAASEVRKLRRTVKAGKRLIIALAVSFALDIIITAGLGVNAVQAHTASQKADAIAWQLHTSQLSACSVGNQTRAEQVQLWTHLANESKAAPGSTPAQARQQRQAIAALLAYVRSTFRQLNCKALYHL